MRVRVIIWYILIHAIIANPVLATDHGDFMKSTYPDGPSVTKDCLSCHVEQGEEFMKTAHWQWKGPTPFLSGHENETELGKRNLINNY